MKKHVESDYGGMLYVISAPSGAGKTSLVKAVLEETDCLEVSVSYTTRPKRPGERDGIEYHFVNKTQFVEMISKESFIEYAEVFGNFYGTSKQRIKEKLQQGIDIILEIDWQGAQQVRQQFPDSVTIFILPPSRAELASRLQERGQDQQEVIDLRMKQSIDEVSHYQEFDFLIINDQFAHALGEFKALITAFRLRKNHQYRKHKLMIDSLLK